MLEMKDNFTHNAYLYSIHTLFMHFEDKLILCVFLFLVVIYEIKFVSIELTDLCHERALLQILEYFRFQIWAWGSWTYILSFLKGDSLSS